MLSHISSDIQNAVEKYNAAARPIGRPSVDWTKVSQYSFLEEFALLKETRQNVLEKPWTQPAVRLTMQQNRRIKRAQEEITRCNVEARHLHTHIVDEDKDVTRILQDLHQVASPIHGALKEWWVRRRNVNLHLLRWIEAIYGLEGFTGERGPGTRKGHLSAASPSDVTTKGKEAELRVPEENDADVDAEVFDDDEACEQLNTVVDFLGTL